MLCSLLLALTSLSAPVHSATTQHSASKPKARTVTKVTYHNSSSQETPAAKTRRLQRECKGRPNAGACLGYAHTTK